MSNSRQLHILFAEDEDSYRLAQTQFLAERGFVVEAVTSGKDAIAALGVGNFDVIILDYDMPDGSGLNVLQWMLEQKDGTPAIVLTGAGSENIAVEAMKLGAYDYLRKDQIDLPHMPIIINGVHERHLFRKEKEEHGTTSIILADSRRSIQVFDDAVNSLSQVISHSLSLLFLNLREFFQDHVVPFQTEENLSESRAAFEDIGKELEIVSTSIKSILSLVASMQEKFAGRTESGKTVQASLEKAATEMKETKA